VKLAALVQFTGVEETNLKDKHNSVDLLPDDNDNYDDDDGDDDEI